MEGEKEIIEEEKNSADVTMALSMDQFRDSETGSSIQVHDVRVSPLARKVAHENFVELSQIRGTGREGRITKDDVLRYIAQKQAIGQSREGAEDRIAKFEQSDAQPVALAISNSERPCVADIAAARSEMKITEQAFFMVITLH